MSSRILILISIIAMFCCAACNDTPTGSKLFFEPKSKDQLIPLARGNYWRYREVIAGKSGQPDGRFVIHDVEKVREAFVVGYDFYTESFGPSVGCGNIRFVFYNTGERAWGVLFEGVLFGTLVDEGTVGAYAMIPKEPKLGMSYKELRCAGMETVLTPAGTFECYRFDRYDRSESYWWSRGTGLVQFVKDSWADQPAEKWVLESYKVQER